MAGISNITMEKIFENKNDDLKKDFIGICSSNSITRFINYYKIINEKDCCYPFAIFNTNRANNPGMHWWSFLNIYPKMELLLFDSQGFQGLKYFIIDNVEPTINKLLYDLNKFNKKDKTMNLVSLKFSIETYHKLEKSEISKLTDTAKDFFHLLAEFAKVNNLPNEMTVVLVDDKIQEIYSNTCGLFQFYFYKNLFDNNENSKILNDEYLTKKTVRTLLNEIFLTNKNENERKGAEFTGVYNISKT